MKLRTSLLTLLLLVGAAASPALGQDGTYLTDENDVAIYGYDVVSYFKSHEAKRGSRDLMTKHDGQTWYFSSQKNLEAFKKNPEKYIPEYGGYCAFAMSKKGAKVESDPETFKIRDGELYLFYNGFNKEGKPFNTIVPWNNANERQMVRNADQNWRKQ